VRTADRADSSRPPRSARLQSVEGARARSVYARGSAEQVAPRSQNRRAAAAAVQPLASRRRHQRVLRSPRGRRAVACGSALKFCRSGRAAALYRLSPPSEWGQPPPEQQSWRRRRLVTAPSGGPCVTRLAARFKGAGFVAWAIGAPRGRDCGERIGGLARELVHALRPGRELLSATDDHLLGLLAATQTAAPHPRCRRDRGRLPAGSPTAGDFPQHQGPGDGDRRHSPRSAAYRVRITRWMRPCCLRYKAPDHAPHLKVVVARDCPNDKRRRIGGNRRLGQPLLRGRCRCHGPPRGVPTARKALPRLPPARRGAGESPRNAATPVRRARRRPLLPRGV